MSTNALQTRKNSGLLGFLDPSIVWDLFSDVQNDSVPVHVSVFHIPMNVNVQAIWLRPLIVLMVGEDPRNAVAVQQSLPQAPVQTPIAPSPAAPVLIVNPVPTDFDNKAITCIADNADRKGEVYFSVAGVAGQFALRDATAPGRAMAMKRTPENKRTLGDEVGIDWDGDELETFCLLAADKPVLENPPFGISFTLPARGTEALKPLAPTTSTTGA